MSSGSAELDSTEGKLSERATINNHNNESNGMSTEATGEGEEEHGDTDMVVVILERKRGGSAMDSRRGSGLRRGFCTLSIMTLKNSDDDTAPSPSSSASSPFLSPCSLHAGTEPTPSCCCRCCCC